MALILRTVSNAGDPLCAPDGTLLASVNVTFTLVSSRGVPTDAWDAQTRERVVGTKTATTDAAGEFSVQLWPTDRANNPVLYLCRVEAPGARSFSAVLPSGPDAFRWSDLMARGQPMTAVQIDILDAYRAGFDNALAEVEVHRSQVALAASDASAAAVAAQAYADSFAIGLAVIATNLIETQALIASKHPL